MQNNRQLLDPIREPTNTTTYAGLTTRMVGRVRCDWPVGYMDEMWAIFARRFMSIAQPHPRTPAILLLERRISLLLRAAPSLYWSTKIKLPPKWTYESVSSGASRLNFFQVSALSDRGEGSPADGPCLARSQSRTTVRVPSCGTFRRAGLCLLHASIGATLVTRTCIPVNFLTAMATISACCRSFP